MKARSFRRCRGSNLVETALVLPVVVLITLGIVEYGRYYYVQSVLFNAAREGARYGIINPTDTDGITSAVRRFAAGVGGQNMAVAVSTPSGTAHGSPITVTVQYQTGLTVPYFAKSLTIVRSSTMLIE